MRAPESYWTRKGPHIPEAKDLPPGACAAGGLGWESLSPGMRREIWRDAIRRETIVRGLSADIQSRIRAMTIAGTMSTLDEYLGAIAREDAKRSPLPEDARRLERADDLHRQGEVQISAREAL